MQCVKTLGLLWFLANSGTPTVYERECSHSSECAVYPNITQGPDVIWMPYFCDEKNVCVCPNGWSPLLADNICITRITGFLTGGTCPAYIWAISIFVVSLVVLITYSCVSLFSRRSYLPRSMTNDQHLFAVNSRAKE